MNDATDELMQATYAALCKHGYAALRMQDIADESSKSKAALHYYYDGKRDLLDAFLDYLYDSFEERITSLDGESPADELLALVETMLCPKDRDAHRRFQTAILEMKAQAPYDDQVREDLERFDQLLHDRVQSLLAAGQRDGAVRADVEPDEAAEFVVTVVRGAQTRAVSVDHPVERTRDVLLAYVTDQLLVESPADGGVHEGSGDAVANDADVSGEGASQGDVPQ